MKIIPRESRKHLEWNPDTTPAPAPISQPAHSQAPMIHVTGNKFSLEHMLEGKTFEHSDLPISLKQALEYATPEGIVLSMPYLIAGKSKAPQGHYLWKTWLTAFSEENIGIDHDGIFVPAGKPVIITVHGDGILGTPERIMQAYADGLTSQNAAKLTDIEFDNLVMGILPTGAGINIYTIDDIKKGNIISNPLGRYAVALDYETAKATKSGYHKKNQFIENPLVLARAGTLEYLSAYFDKAKDSDGDVANYHRLAEIDPNTPQGRVLFVYDSQNGLNGNDILNGRFVGVGPGGTPKP